MPKFIVYVDRTVTDSVEIHVEADEANAAMAKALHQAVYDSGLKWQASDSGITYRVQWDDDDDAV